MKARLTVAAIVALPALVLVKYVEGTIRRATVDALGPELGKSMAEAAEAMEGQPGASVVGAMADLPWAFIIIILVTLPGILAAIRWLSSQLN